MFYQIFQSSPIAITIVNLSDGRYVDINPAAERLLGSSRAELMGRPQAAWEQTLMPTVRDDLLRLFADQGRVVAYPCTLTTRAGTPRNCLLSIERLELDGHVYAITHIVDVSAQHQTTEDGTARREAEETHQASEAHVQAVMTCTPDSIFTDIMERKQAQAAIQQACDRFTGLFHASLIPTGLTSLPDHRILDVNVAAERLLGYTRQELLGQIIDAVPIAVDPHDYQEVNTLLATQGQIRGREVRLRTATGEEKTCLLSIETLQLEESRYALTQLVDITARKEAERALQRSEQILHEAQSMASLGSWSADLRAGTFVASPEGAQLVGWSPGLHTLDELIAVIHPDDQALMQAAWAAAMHGAPYDIENRIILNGETRWLRVKAVVSWDADGVPLSAVGITQDITAQKVANIALQQASTRLQILADASAAFAAGGMDEQALLDTLTQCTAEALECGCFIRLRQGTEPWLKVVAGHDSDPAILAQLGTFVRHTQVHIDDHHPAALVVRSGQPRLTPELDPEILRTLLPPAFWPAFEHVRLHSELIAPLRVHGQTIGCLVLLRHTPSQPAFTQDDLTLAQDLADRAGLAIANAWLYRDVQAAQRTAQQAHARLEALITSLPMGVGYLDRELRYQLVNPALAAINGHSPAAHLGQSVSAILPNLAPRFEPLLRQVLETGITISNLKFQSKKHSTDDLGTWLVSYFPIPGPAGEITGVGAAVTDITASLRTEAALQASMTKLHAALDSMTDAIFITDTTGHLIEFNEAFATFHRFQGKHECPLTLDAYPIFLEFLLPSGERASAEQGVVARALRGETATNAEYILRRTDTGETWVGSYSFAPVRDQDGAIVGAVVISRDITASKEAELRLRQSEARFATIFERSPIALGISQLSNGKITDVNAAFLSLYGYTREAVIGRTTLELGLWAYPADRQHVLEQLHTKQRLARFEAVARIASGEERPVLISGELVQIHDEPHVLIQIMDITALKVAQQELLELNRTLEERVQQRTAEVQDLYEHAPTGYYSTNADGQITRINQTLLDWLGYTREEVLGRWGIEFLAPEIRDAFVAQIPTFKQRNQVQGLDAQLLRKDGSIFPVLLSVTSIYDADGAYVSNRATVFDNTQRKWAEDALRESEAQNRLLFEESPAAMVLIDLHARIVRANRAFAQLVGHPIERVQDQFIATLGLISPTQIAQLAADVGPALTDGPGIAHATVTIQRGDGDFRVVEVRVFSLTIHGQWHSLASVHDITRERQTEETLRRANAELARAARAKDEFLANMSHELRTPINTILAYSESLQDAIYDPLTLRQHRAIAAVAAAGQHLLTLINDILDLAKIEAGRMELQIQRVALRAISEASLEFVREQAHKKQLRLSLQISDPDASLEVDATRLKQMLVNLLSNAVKFTPTGGAVRLDIRIDRAAGIVRLVVEDTGIGIAPEDLGRLFQPFSQVDAALDRAYEGTGLGLALVRRLAELHGGSVTVESDLGKGSRFTIALPYRIPPAAPLAPGMLPLQSAGGEPALGDARRGRILLAEDNEANIGALSDYLQAKGYAVVVARDGHEALARADEVQPHLILMDIQMPGMDGLTAIRQLRAQSAYATIPIIALTALAMPGDKERCLAAGATMYLTKPFVLRDLVATIQRLLER